MKKKVKQENIRTKIMSRMSKTILAATIIIGIVGTIMNYISTMNLLEQTLTETVQIAAERVEQELQVYSNIVYEIGCMTQLSDAEMTVEQKQDFIDQRAKVHGFTRGNVLDSNGTSIFDGNNYADRAYYQAAIKGDTFVSEPLISKVTGEFTVIIAAPIWENGVPESKVVGVVYFVPVGTFLNDIVNSIQVSDNTITYMLNGSGTVIAHHDMENVTNEVNTIEAAKSDSSLKALAKLEQKMINGETGLELTLWG